MGNSGVGMVLGQDTIYLWVIGVIVLGLLLAYGAMKAGRLRRSEREQLDRNTQATQGREDPYKRPT